MTTMDKNSEKQDGLWKNFLILAVAAIIGATVFIVSTVSTIPDLYANLGEQAAPPPPDSVIILGGIVQLTVLISLATWGGLKLAAKMNVNITPILNNSVSDKRLLWGLGSGIVAGIAMLITHQFVFLPITGIPVNVSAEMPVFLGLANVFLYGGITEEVLIRLGLMTLFLWLGSKVQSDNNGAPTLLVFWIVNVIVTIIFGLLHLPGAVILLGVVITPIVIIQALVLNAVALLFGWLYWHKGIETAIISHMGVHVGYTLLAIILF